MGGEPMSKGLRITILVVTAILLSFIFLLVSHPNTDILDPISIAILAAAFVWLWIWLKRRLFPRTVSRQADSGG